MYTARGFELTVTAGTDGHTYTITPTLVDAVGRREIDDDIDTYTEQHGLGGLATVVSYAVDRVQGQTTPRLMARDLELSPLEAEIILQALEPVVRTHVESDTTGAAVDAVTDRETYPDDG